jgi:hypothetical protein
VEQFWYEQDKRGDLVVDSWRSNPIDETGESRFFPDFPILLHGEARARRPSEDSLTHAGVVGFTIGHPASVNEEPVMLHECSDGRGIHPRDLSSTGIEAIEVFGPHAGDSESVMRAIELIKVSGFPINLAADD